MIRRVAFAAAALLAIALAACGGGSKGGALPTTQSGGFGNSAVPPQLLVQSYGQSAMSGATYVGPVTNAHLDVSVLVHQQNAQALIAYAQAVSDPNSPNFRHYLTPDQIATQFGAKQSDYQAVAQYFVSQGLSVGGWKQRMLLTVAGPQANMERAFGTTFGLYSHNGQTFVAPNTQPHFQQQLAVDAVGNMVRYRADHPYIIIPPHAAQGYSTGFSPSTVRAAFDYQGAYNAGYTGSGIVLGIIATGPIDTTPSGNGDVDLNALLSDTNTTNAAIVTQKNVTTAGVANGLSIANCNTPSCTFPYSGDFQTPPPATKPCGGALPGCNPEDGEAQLDTQQAATLAPGASVWFYLAYNAADCSNVTFPNACATNAPDYGPEIGIVEADPEIMQAISDNDADVVSISYGGGEPQQGWTGLNGNGGYTTSYSALEFAALATEGIAVFVSSGDDGSAECFSGSSYLAQQCVSYPSGDPNVTSVGGITANIDVYGQQTAPWLAWGISTFDTGYGAFEGSGGGNSATGGIGIPAPAWQVSALGSNVATSRMQPDVSMIGDPSTGVAFVTNAQSGWGGGISGVGGTSVAAPEMAAMWADVLSACAAHPGVGVCPASGHRLGNAAPYLYAIYACTATPCTKPFGVYNGASFTPAMQYNQVFYDIIYGDNQMANPVYSPASPVPGYPAGPGYDQVTGVGVPYAGHLIDAITGLSVP